MKIDATKSCYQTSAFFSDCGTYRYSLVRDGKSGEGMCNFIMLNPSTADEHYNDPTVERCQRRAFSMGFKTLIVTNIFALRSTDPAALKQAGDPVGPDNNDWIMSVASVSDLVVCAWGNHGNLWGRGDGVRKALIDRGIDIHVLKLSKSGVPSHPLYISYSEKPKPWSNL